MLDAGADKPLAFLNDAHEENPALGLRGLRALRASEDILLAVVLVGLGATSLSMAPTALADVRATLLQHTLDDAREIAAAALAASDAASARTAAQAATRA